MSWNFVGSASPETAVAGFEQEILEVEAEIGFEFFVNLVDSADLVQFFGEKRLSISAFGRFFTARP